MMQIMGILSSAKIECCDGSRVTVAYNNHATKPVIYSVQSRDTKLRKYYKMSSFNQSINARFVGRRYKNNTTRLGEPTMVTSTIKKSITIVLTIPSKYIISYFKRNLSASRINVQ